MATTSISDLALEASTALASIADSATRLRAKTGRTARGLLSELDEAVNGLHDAVTAAEALIEIASSEPLTAELREIAALAVATMFLGRRLFETNVAQVAELHPELATTLEPALEVARLLGSLSDSLLAVVEAQHRTHRGGP